MSSPETTKQPISKLSELLAAIRRRPGLYMGHASLDRLDAFLAGFSLGRPEKFDWDIDLQAFDKFVCDRYDWHDVGGWAGKIAYHHRNQAEALDEFFKLLDEFIATAGKEARQSGRGNSSPAA